MASSSINSQKKWTRSVSSHLDWTCLVNKGFSIIIKLLENVSYRTQWIAPGILLPTQVANVQFQKIFHTSPTEGNGNFCWGGGGCIQGLTIGPLFFNKIYLCGTCCKLFNYYYTTKFVLIDAVPTQYFPTSNQLLPLLLIFCLFCD